MSSDYPDDADGEVLRRVAQDGSDMSAPMEIDFTIEAPNESVAKTLSAVIAARGYSPRIHHDEDGSVSLYCALTMVATYEGVIAKQHELNEICEPYGAACDGWLTAGNLQTHGTSGHVV